MSLISRRPTDTGRFRSGFDSLLRDMDDTFGLGGGLLAPFAGMGTSMTPFSTSLAPSTFTGTLMRTDLRETDKQFEMKMDMPGVSKDAINITVDDSANAITVTTEKKESKEQTAEETGGWLLKERSWGKASRTQVLPPTADVSKANVELKDGILLFSVPKREAVPGQRQLTIG